MLSTQPTLLGINSNLAHGFAGNFRKTSFEIRRITLILISHSYSL
jgi:hypothetical protein